MAFIAGIVEIIFTLLLQHLTALLIFVTVFLSTRYFLITRYKRPLPPGPWGVPILGYLPFIGKSMHLTLHELSKKYGPVYRINMGIKTVVVLADPEMIRQSFKREEFTGRPNSKLYDMFQGNGVINISGDKWKAQRRFLQERLRTLGMKVSGPGREQMENRIVVEVEHLLQSLASHKGESISPDYYFKIATANVVCFLLMSVRFEKNDPTFKRFIQLHQEGFQLFVTAEAGNYLPLMKYTTMVKSSIKQLESNQRESFSLLQGFIDERREHFDPNATRDIIDAYLHEEYMAKKEGKTIDDAYNRQLLQVMCDLFSAGQETTYSWLNWCLVMLLHNKEVMRNVQNELDSVVGRNRLPSMNDMSSLPYTQATMYEVLRVANVIPVGPPHATTTDTFVGKYLIPAGTTVFPNLYSCHMNDKSWPNPEKFDPTRFIDEKGQVFKPQDFIPFGVGRRMCLGEVLARSEIFLFLTSILHVFNLEAPEDPKDFPTTEGIAAITNAPVPFKIRFLPREISVLSPKDDDSSRRACGV